MVSPLLDRVAIGDRINAFFAVTPPKGGFGIKQIVRIEPDEPGIAIAGPGRKQYGAVSIFGGWGGRPKRKRKRISGLGRGWAR